MKLVEQSLKYGVTVAVGVIFILMFGIISLLRIPVQLTPEISQPELSIRTYWPGASPEEIEREIIDEQELHLKSIVGLVSMESTAKTGIGEIYLDFQVGSDLQDALVRTANALNQVPTYPEDADEPIIKTVNVSDRPIGWFVLSPLPGKEKEINVYHYRDFAEDFIKTRFERIPGVSDSSVYGGSPLELQVTFNPHALAERRISIYQLREALRKQNRNISGGDFDEGKRRYIIRTTGEFESPENVENTIITHVDGRPVYVKDVADVKVDYDELRDYVRHNGLPGIAVNTRREIGSNIIEVMHRIKAEVVDLNQNLLHPMGLHLTQTADKTEYISRSIDMVTFNLTLGGTMAVVILLLFLRSLYSTLVIALAIPISVIGSFLVITLMGRTINVIMLAGMAFAVGMVVDASIIVLENIYRHRQMGKDTLTAAFDGAREVWGAIFASTLTTLAVFIPILFIEEEVGQLFQDIAVAISAAVTLSMIVSILVIPALSRKLLNFESMHPASRGVFSALFKNVFGLVPLAAAFNRWVVSSLRRIFEYPLMQKTLILVLTAVPLAGAWFMIPKTEYLPEGDQNVIIGMMIPPQGYNISEMHRIGDDMEKHYRAYWEATPGSPEEANLEGPAVRNFLFIGSRGRLFTIVKAKDPERSREMIPVLKKELKNVPGMIAITRQLSLFSSAFSGSRGIEMNIMGPDLVKITEIARNAFFKLKDVMPGAQIRPKPGIELGQPQLRVKPRWQTIAELDLDVFELGYSVAALVDGVYADEVYLNPDKVEVPYMPREGIDLILQSREQDVKKTQDIPSMLIYTQMGRAVPLVNVAEMVETVSSEEIRHFERKRSITLEISPPAKMALEEGIDIVKQQIIQPLKDDGTLSGEYAINLSGNADKLEKTRIAMQGNFIMAIVITYLLLAVLFQHWGFPLIIMLSVPMAAVGGIFGLWTLNRFVLQPLDVLTMLGFIILIGVVVNNAILIIYQALLHIREEGMFYRDAILESVRNRIRPIFMSTFTSIFGLMPLVVIPGAGSEVYRGIGVVILSGLFFSTLFTLILIPCLLNLSLAGSGSDHPTRPGGDRQLPSTRLPESALRRSTEI
ncbi:MAG: MMPL family transporter [Nitrospinaceae bacterium]|nr:efflux RND transporter permease subunit [Nitrospinaceae bacterium]NIR57465.1 efflux RND transporter permease subunit [Nitrospinaceae bacterium]NIS87932.1 efflux RND transporter permease subunit [Nitrospinaceae bacterium]NIT84800.1 efflux RND transporter permease subunit [Nitrospinaceae bacterium]NIU46976.1 efflux RND transporter permease subunit [Nitrospinaceae bacterium]